MGRRKIDIEPLIDDRNKTVTFVKRKGGLFKKAYELAVLCNVEIAVLIIGSNDKVHEFSSVDSKEVINAYERKLRNRERIDSKSLETYEVYKKKTHLHEPLTRMSDGKQFPIRRSGAGNHGHGSHGSGAGGDDDGDIDDDEDEEEDDDDDDEDDHETTSRKRQRTGKPATSTSSSRGPIKHKNTDLLQPSTFTRGNIFNSNFRKNDEQSLTPSSISSSSNSDSKYKSQSNDDISKPSLPTISTKPVPPLTTTTTATNTTVGQRPVLRVQIPIDHQTSNSNDSARTITAIDTQIPSKSGGGLSSNDSSGSSDSNNPIRQPNNINPIHHNHHNHLNHHHGHIFPNGNANNNNNNNSSNNGLPNINTSKYPHFRSPDSRKPTLPMPISQTTSPASSTAPAFPHTNFSNNNNVNPNMNNNSNNNNIGNFPGPAYSPSTYTPTTALNQILGQQQQPPQHYANSEKIRHSFYGGASTGTPALNSAATEQHQQQQQQQQQPAMMHEDFLQSPSIFQQPEWLNNGGSTGFTPTTTSNIFFGISAGGNGVTQFPLSGLNSGGGMPSRAMAMASPTTFMQTDGPRTLATPQIQHHLSNVNVGPPSSSSPVPTSSNDIGSRGLVSSGSVSTSQGSGSNNVSINTSNGTSGGDIGGKSSDNKGAEIKTEK